MEKELLKLKTKSLDYVYSESEKLLNETFTSFRRNSDKSYIAVAFYLGLIYFFYSQLEDNSIFSIIGIFLYTISILLILKSLKPRVMNLIGSQVKDIELSYYEQFDSDDEKLRQMKISRIIAIDEAIDENKSEIIEMSKYFKWSINFSVFSAVILFGFRLWYCAI